MVQSKLIVRSDGVEGDVRGMGEKKQKYSSVKKKLQETKTELKNIRSRTKFEINILK